MAKSVVGGRGVAAPLSRPKSHSTSSKGVQREKPVASMREGAAVRAGTHRNRRPPLPTPPTPKTHQHKTQPSTNSQQPHAKPQRNQVSPDSWNGQDHDTTCQNPSLCRCTRNRRKKEWSPAISPIPTALFAILQPSHRHVKHPTATAPTTARQDLTELGNTNFFNYLQQPWSVA